MQPIKRKLKSLTETPEEKEKRLRRNPLGPWVISRQKSHNPLRLNCKNEFYRSVSCCEGKKRQKWCNFAAGVPPILTLRRSVS